MQDTHQQAVEILGPYAMPHDLARLYYGRLLWRKERTRERLLRHWTDERHPYRDRFLESCRPVVEEGWRLTRRRTLNSTPGSKPAG